ncbi:HAD family hydrolase [Pelagibius sp. Alg239-R121]|uniref:HAD family hydrolase n=1 Tax=Pelagibius sp. Alg239-R121 TaxID=2993448 RepID=UPI0024A7A220|nr:HAD family hydrolase [Pelagibius sp. Alg239-R121]
MSQLSTATGAGSLVRPRAILFDWDNTLVDTWVVIHHALKITFEAMGQEPWTLSEAKERVRESAREAFPKLFGDRAEEALGVFYGTYEADHLEMLTPLPGAESMLQSLAADPELFLGLVSNKKGTLLRLEAQELGWAPYFGSMVGANDAEKDKPAAAAVEMALAPSALKAGPDVWFVGDTDIDMACAVATGCTAVLLRPDPPGTTEFAGCRPNHYIDGCGALIDLVQAS